MHAGNVVRILLQAGERASHTIHIDQRDTGNSSGGHGDDRIHATDLGQNDRVELAPQLFFLRSEQVGDFTAVDAFFRQYTGSAHSTDGGDQPFIRHFVGIVEFDAAGFVQRLTGDKTAHIGVAAASRAKQG